MVRHRRSNAATAARYWHSVGAILAVLTATAAADAAVIATGDPADRYGLTPGVFTVDPFDPMYGGPPVAGHNRGVANTRMLRQTFKNASEVNVGQINISFDVTNGSSIGSVNDTGIRIAIYTVEDVLASSWTTSSLIKEVILLPGSMPPADQVFRLDLTGGDVFALPQRDAGTTGYGLEISTPNSEASDGNPGLIWFTDVTATQTDFYVDGRYYTELGNASTAYRDIGISLVASDEMPCEPGDVNCVDGVDLDDLAIIAANFRTNGGRELGDLTGNGFIDFDDFDEWKQNYPDAGSASAAIAAIFAGVNVPEPASATLLACGLVGLASGGARRRRN